MTIGEELLTLVKEVTGEHSVNLDTDIFDELGCVGDDFHELIEEFAQIFEVDMSDYLWYFHSVEEGLNLGSLFIDPPYKRVI